MKITILFLTTLMVGCTTGSKYKYIENNYTNVQSFGSTGIVEDRELIVEKPVYVYDEQDATMGDLGKAIGKKLLRKMYAAYNTN